MMPGFQEDLSTTRRSPKINRSLLEQERQEKRKAILAPPASYWTIIGTGTLIVGIILLAIGIKSFIENANESPGISLLSFSLFGASIIIIGLLASILGILFIIAGINRRSEQRLGAIQFLSEEHSRYLRRLASINAHDGFLNSSAELLDDIQSK